MNEDVAMTQKKDKRPLIFLAVGICNTLLDFLFYTLLTQIVFAQASQIGLAGIISGTFALLCAFATHNFITWRERPTDRKTVLRFFAFTGFGMWFLRPILLSIFIRLKPLYIWAQEILQHIHIDLGYEFIAHTGAFGFMVIVVLVYNYLVYDRYVFLDKK